MSEADTFQDQNVTDNTVTAKLTFHFMICPVRAKQGDIFCVQKKSWT